MTITFDWWALLPIRLVILAVIFGFLGERHSGMLVGLGEVMISCVLVLMAAMVCVGHYL
jgi:hypothetical protein